MKRPRLATTGTRIQLALLVVLCVSLAVLLYLSSRTGQAEYDASKARLDAIEVFNMRLDGAMFPLMFEMRTDFDELAQLEGDLADAVAGYRMHGSGDGAQRLMAMVEDKLVHVDEFKSRLAVLRNSARIATQTVEAIRARQDDGRGQALADVHFSLLEFLSRRDPPSMESMAQAMASVPDDGPLAADPDWPVLVAHVERMLGETEAMGEVLMAIYMPPLHQTLLEENVALAERMAVAAAAASNYRLAAFVVGVLIILFSAVKVLEIRRYLRMVEAANDELEHRVDLRTAELAGANDQLRREMEEREGMEARLQIAERLESVGRLAAGVAHEINTPVQYISDNVEFVAAAWDGVLPLLADCERGLSGRTASADDTGADAAPAPARALWKAADVPYLREQLPRALEQARTGLGRISGIVRAMEEFARSPGDSQGEVDLNRTVSNAVTVTRSEWKYVAQIDLRLDPDLPPVRCDGAAINQVLLNLLVNAVQALSRGNGASGTIRVETARVGDAVEVRVEDSGPGVDRAIRARVFDPFFTTRDVGQGRGQGLTIAHRIVEVQHGGSLTVGEGRLGGARFTVRLPLHEAVRVAS